MNKKLHSQKSTNIRKNNFSNITSKLLLAITIFLGSSVFSQSGSLDLTFASGTATVSGQINSMVVQTDGKVIIGGTFTSYNGTAINRICRVNTDGSIDPTFNVGTGANANVTKLLLQTDGKVIMVGNFTNYKGTARNRILRINTDGTIDGTFNIGTGANSQIYSAAIQPDGKIIIAGTFTSYNGNTSILRIARLNTDGSVDNTFSPGTGPDNWVYAMAIQPDGKIVIVGGFSSYNGTTVNKVARITSTGALDNILSFNAGTAISTSTTYGYALGLQSDGKIIIGGSFTTFNGTAKNRLVRLNTNGSIDNTFNSGGANAANIVYTCKVLPDDKILLGGNFATFNGSAPARLTCLNSDGTKDATFNTGGAGANATSVLDIQLNSNKDIFIGGSFTTYNGTSRNRLAKVTRACSTASISALSASSQTICGAGSTTLSVTGTLNDATNWQWYNASCGSGSVGSGTTIVVSPSVTTTYYVRGEGGCNSISCSTISVNVFANPSLSVTPSSTNICLGSITMLNASGASSYTWNPGNISGSSAAVGPSVTTTYTVNGVDGNGCSNTSLATITVSNCITPTKLTNALCNSTLSVLNSSTRLYCDPVSGATNYQWEFTDVSTGTIVLTKLRNAQWTDFYLTGYFPSIQFNKTYSIKVRAYVGGIWGNYGTACLLTTPTAPALSTQLSTAYCNSTLTTLSNTTRIYCDAVTGATDYEWEFTDVSTGNVVFTKKRAAQWTDFYLKGYFTTIQLNKTYSIKVRSYVTGTWSSYGPACLLTTPSSFSRLTGSLVDESGSMSEYIINTYPNPVSNNLNVELDLIPKNAVIEIYNSLGELVLNQELTDYTNLINTTKLSSGLYHVKIIGNNQLLQAGKIIKQ